MSFGSQIADIGSGALSVYSLFSTVAIEKKADQVLGLLAKQTAALEKLGDGLFLAPHSLPTVLTSGPSERVNLRDVRRLLMPVQKSLGGGPLVSSAALMTPKKLRTEMSANAWDTLYDPRPLGKHSMPPNASYAPIFFFHDGIPHLGWLQIGALRASFDIDFRNKLEAWQPEGSPSPEVQKAKIEKTPPKSHAKEKPRTDSREGTVRFWEPKKKYGFITPASGGDDVFVRLEEIEQAGLRALVKGQEVKFETQPDPKGRGPMAVKLSVRK